MATTQGPSSVADNSYSKSSSKYSSSNTTASNSGSNNEATKRFANAKSISSAQYFGGESGSSQGGDSHQDKLSRFQGSSSISSEDYFGDGKSKRQSSSGMNNTPDLNVIKQDLKEGVTKMAGKLSNMASNVMSSFQVRKFATIVLCCWKKKQSLSTLCK